MRNALLMVLSVLALSGCGGRAEVAMERGREQGKPLAAMDENIKGLRDDFEGFKGSVIRAFRKMEIERREEKIFWLHQAILHDYFDKKEEALNEAEALREVRREIMRGADVNGMSKGGWTPLYAATAKGYRDVAELLLKNGADVNMKTNDGRTPLHLAVLKGNRDIAELLLSWCADPSLEDGSGQTALLKARMLGRKGIAELLREHGAKD